MVTKILAFAILQFAPLAQAEFQLGAQIGLLQDQNSIASRNVVQSNFYDVSVYTRLQKDYKLYLGFEYVYFTSSNPGSSSTTETMTASNALAGFKYGFGARQLITLSLLGSPAVQANYKVAGSPSDLWSGYAYIAKISVEPEISKSVGVCMSLAYFSAVYTSKSSSSGSSTVNSFSRSAFVPTLGLQIKF